MTTKKSYKSEGYLPEELSPAEYEQVSRDAVLKQPERWREYAGRGGAVAVDCHSISEGMGISVTSSSFF